MTEKRSERLIGRGVILKLVGLGVPIFIVLLALVLNALSTLERGPTRGVILARPQATIPSDDTSTVIRPFPDTRDGIYVFNDQLGTWQMSEAQFEFAANHYVGTQKIFASDIRRLRAHNPDFIVLNYRLGLGLGYQETNANCTPSGAWIEVIEGERYLQEYPQNPLDEWFFIWQDQRVLFCDWGWYLMEIDNPSWRQYWSTEVLRQLQANTADGLFVDSLSVPNTFGATRFQPSLPELDQAFEEDWSRRIEDFIAYGQTGELAKYYFIPNVGEWVTGRDITDYSEADGVMVEGFARWTEGDYFSAQDGDWQLQMDRILGLTEQNKIILLQQYVDSVDLQDRLFLLSSYLLVKGRYTYLNLDISQQPEWFPEYEISIGSPVGEPPTTISALWRSDWGLYARAFSNGLALVNPTIEAQRVSLGGTYYQAMPAGGGLVPEDGDISAWGIDYAPVTSIILQPNQGAVLLTQIP
jgi:hypothetical protein